MQYPAGRGIEILIEHDNVALMVSDMKGTRDAETLAYLGEARALHWARGFVRI